ncbi:unnamed protein product [Cuscuta epithymum]|uniref:Glutaredoxin domain-containing protein n=1 Tax=Cuscuta epithymum TaxID=186058 RepID=A0AAV0F1F2_9ASTE|nr:unnamed protein product [Cuscuta epithymum]
MWHNRTNTKIRVLTDSCSTFSFKDIQTLFADDPTRLNNPAHFSKHYIIHRVRLANALLRALSPQPEPFPVPQSLPEISLPGSEKQIVVYSTSLRVVRRTFSDCRDVLSILRSYRVSIDERDLCADAGFVDELQRILGVRERTKLTLPQVFIRGRYIGGAAEIRRLHEAGELKKCVEGLPPASPDACEMCGGHRYILCDECSGSRKGFCGDKLGGFSTCTACGQSGLTICPSCAPF